MDLLRRALKMLLDEGYPVKEIAFRIGVSVHTIYRADPERFATARKKRRILVYVRQGKRTESDTMHRLAAGHRPRTVSGRRREPEKK